MPRGNGIGFWNYDEYVEEFEHLFVENKKLKHIVGKFADWNCEHCPFEEKWFCPAFDELKKKYGKDEINYDPTDDCGIGESGWCWAKYYEKCFLEGEGKYNDRL